MRSRLQAAESVGGEGNPSYAENFCSTVYDAATKSFNYGCYVHLKPLQFEACHLSRCPTVTVSRVPLLGPLTITLLLLFIVLCFGLLGVALWRGYAPLHAGYRRYFTPVRFRSNRMRRSSVQFIPPDKLAYGHRIDGEPDSGHTRSCLAHSNGLLSAVDNDKQAGSIYVPDPPQIQNQGYTNPIYNSLTVSVPEDDYDPEAEL
ncbi:hypothetical protein PHET_10312 [Paragonimus heterotremus]|uniref:Uncharacterized protein n=1 Tax=Paragonimus heterotremus TaxID=100268 RepID=A0A8J4SGA0_9TREM|nr:hypothetical protein PHET_10312 [Paragonimus heterotremus]